MTNQVNLQTAVNSPLTLSTVVDSSGTFQTVTLSGNPVPPPPNPAPTLPADLVVGTPAARMIAWSGDEIFGGAQATFNNTKANGWGGTEYTSGSPYAQPAAAVALANTAGYESYAGLYFTNQAASSIGTLAAAAKAAGMTGLAFDTEQMQWATIDNPTAYAAGQAVAQAIWGAFTAAVLLYYHYSMPGGWGDVIQQTANSAPYPHAAYQQDSFFQGLLAGMQSVGAAGRIVLVDANFYRDAGVQVPGANNQAAYFLNSQATRALLSTALPSSTWGYAVDHFDIAGFTWRGADGTPWYDNTEEGDTQWVQSIMDARNYSEGSRRAEYIFNNQWQGNPVVPSGVAPFSYTSATNLAGAQVAAATTPLASAAPKLLSVGASTTGGTTTINATVSHAYGIRGVKVYAADGVTYLGAMQMTFVPDGGTPKTNYANAYQQCSFSTPGSSGQWFILKAISIKDDVHYASVQG